VAHSRKQSTVGPPPDTAELSRGSCNLTFLHASTRPTSGLSLLTCVSIYRFCCRSGLFYQNQWYK